MAPKKLSILIKARNEEAKIEACVRSCLREVQGIDAEIIVVDSRSTDRTVAIVSQFPVTIVQFQRPVDCGPGAAVELGFRHSSGEFVYVLDGDMTFEVGFLRVALDWLESNSSYAGVAGLLTDTMVVNHEDRRREAMKPSGRPGDVDRLSGGGLYRRSDIARVGYLSHPGLRACEEAELGFRLMTAGCRLHRLAIPAVRHTGHGIGSLALIGRHFRSGRIYAGGVWLRLGWRTPHRNRILLELAHPLATLGFWLAFGLAGLIGMQWLTWTLAAAAGLLYVGLAFRKRSLLDATFSLLMWNVSLVGLVGGVARTPGAANREIPAQVLQQGM